MTAPAPSADVTFAYAPKAPPSYKELAAAWAEQNDYLECAVREFAGVE